MKFGKLFTHQIQEAVPEWRNKFLSYKKLKKLIRKIPECGNAEEEFLSLLNNDIDTLNEFFIDKEEEFIIRYQELQQDQKKSINLCGPNGTQPSEMDNKEGMYILLKHIVDLHSEMILLLNLWNINQTGFAKLVKKYERRTSGLQRYPFLQKVLEHQFLTSEFIPKLVTECESIINEVIFHVGENSKTPNEEAIALMENLYSQPSMMQQWL